VEGPPPATFRCAGAQASGSVAWRRQAQVQSLAGEACQQVAGRIEGHHPSLLEHRNPPAQGFGLFKIVRGQDHRVAVAIEAADELPQALAQFDVDAGSRLVEDNHRRLVHQRLGDEHPSLHAAGQAAHVGVGLGREIQVGENLVDPVVIVANSEVAGLYAQGLAHREERVKDQFLRHHAQQTAGSAVVGDDVVTHHDQLAGIRAGEAGQA
jgi:hypothetical protein